MKCWILNAIGLAIVRYSSEQESLVILRKFVMMLSQILQENCKVLVMLVLRGRNIRGGSDRGSS